MYLKWLPWKYVVRRVARARGFVDPISVLHRLHQFAEPSEVTAPLELLRAGVVFHARGLMNSGAIQHNLDWIWPYWVERQFDPDDPSFMPRAFSITHVNLTHRNWTAVGLPGCEHLPIVDPRGLLTPFWDGWSIDGWIFRDDGTQLIPSRTRVVRQDVDFSNGMAVFTECEHSGMRLFSEVDVLTNVHGQSCLRQRWNACSSDHPAWLVLSVRPYNPEGVSFVHEIHLDKNEDGWRIGKHGHVHFSRSVDGHFTSDYKHGDVSKFNWAEGLKSVSCRVGMATAAAVFAIPADQPTDLELTIPLDEPHHHHWLSWPSKDAKNDKSRADSSHRSPTLVRGHAKDGPPYPGSWEDEMRSVARLKAPDPRITHLHDIALRTLVLHMPGEVYPGPFTYKRFWVRDTAFMLNAALCVGMHDRARNAIPHLLARQDKRGYFHSQEGEWDANGQALWLLERYFGLTNKRPERSWCSVVRRAADWIVKKRKPLNSEHVARGLLPAGFSAEHLGPNDYYYWDDFWSVAGLHAAARFMQSYHREPLAKRYERQAEDLDLAIQHSLERTDYLRKLQAYPAAPERRMDAGAIGSVVASYPLQLVPPEDLRMQETVNFLREYCFVKGGFFQDMIHSGINPYLTLHVAQVMLRSGDSEWFELVNSVAKLATSTGQWPEAIHPQTLGGCMGDGQHAWAAAEWLMAIRNMFVREEGDTLVIGSGIPAHWHYSEHMLEYGPTWTPWGSLKLTIDATNDDARINWQANWHHKPKPARIAIPSYEAENLDMSAPEGAITIQADYAVTKHSV